MTGIARVRVGDLLQLMRRAVDVDPADEYREIGVRSFGKGIFHKEPVSGVDLGAKRVFRIEPGDLVISNVFAWEGAISVASEDEAGMIGSHRFMTFVPRDDRIDASWAAWFLLSKPGLSLVGRASPGSAGRNRTLAVERFENLAIPLPPFDEQRRVAERLGRVELAARELRLLELGAKTLTEALSVSTCARLDLTDDDKSRTGWRRVDLGSVMAPELNTVAVDVAKSYPNLGIYSFGRGVFEKPMIDGRRTSAKTLHRVRASQFIYSRLFAFEGAYTFVPQDFDGYFVSNEFPTFDPDPEQLDARWLASYLRSPSRWSELAGSSKGLGVRRQRIPVEAILAYKVWLPPIDVQRSMVAVLERLESAQAVRREAEARIDSLLPAGLNRAFAGLS